jgi:hypothetical protein
MTPMTDRTATGRQDPNTARTASMQEDQPAAVVNADDLHEYWPGDTSPSVVAALQEEFPAYQISRQLAVGQVGYVACRLHPGTHPHTVMSADPAKLRAALTAGRA